MSRCQKIYQSKKSDKGDNDHISKKREYRKIMIKISILEQDLNKDFHVKYTKN